MIRVNYFEEPIIRIVSPDTATTYDTPYETMFNEIVISGTTYNTVIGDTVEIFVNSQSQGETYITALDGGWSGTALLTGIGDSVWVKLSDGFARAVYDTKTANYFEEPLVGITDPATETTDGTPYDTNVQSVVLSGTSEWTKSEDTVAVYINDELQSETATIVTIHGGWTLPAITLNDYLNTVVVEVNDNWGRQHTDTIYIYYYATPIVEITSPINFHDTAEQIIAISGTTKYTKSGDTVELYVNDNADPDTYFVITEYNGNWSGTVELTNIGDSVRVKVVQDFFGASTRTEYDTITVNYFDTLILEIQDPVTGTDPAAPYPTTSPNIVISGTVAQVQIADTIIIELNGALENDSIVTVSSMGDTEWSIEIALQDRMNTAVIIATDQFGRTSYDTRYIYKQPTPEIKITIPEAK